MRTRPIEKLLEQHCYTSAADLLQLVLFYVCTYFTLFRVIQLSQLTESIMHKQDKNFKSALIEVIAHAFRCRHSLPVIINTGHRIQGIIFFCFIFLAAW